MSHICLPELRAEEDKTSAFKNRIRKNYRHTSKFCKRTQTDCFRLYDRDIKEYPLSIDCYGGKFCVSIFSFDHSEEFEEEFKKEIAEVLLSLFKISQDDIVWKTRMKREKGIQYEKLGSQGEPFICHEYGLSFKINLTDYLDTGLFLDHRETRRLVGEMAQGKRLLNLFAYTCSFSVHAASKGALHTTSVDLSNTYTQWGRENFLLNGISLENHTIIRADCLKFLETERNKYDLIVIDPPTLSRSKKMDGFFDVQEDYAGLILRALRLLAPQGTLFFSTNFRKFKFDPSLFSKCSIQEITPKTIPLDFHNKKIHRCWKFNHK